MPLPFVVEIVDVPLGIPVMALGFEPRPTILIPNRNDNSLPQPGGVHVAYALVYAVYEVFMWCF